MDRIFSRNIFYFRNYYLNFYQTLNPEVRRKMNWTLQLITTTERVPAKFFKHIADSEGIFEIMVEVGSEIFRVFSFFDQGNLIILVNGFKKKTPKTPKGDLALAHKLKRQYFDEKQER
jgi:phage-related protein